jgi:hypothetical protein
MKWLSTIGQGLDLLGRVLGLVKEAKTLAPVQVPVDPLDAARSQAASQAAHRASNQKFTLVQGGKSKGK